MNEEKVSYLSEVINTLVDKKLYDIHTCLPGHVEKYDYSTGKADIKPLIKKKFKDGDILSLPVIPNVPVQYPSTSEAILHLPLNKGDTGIIVFSERSLEIWLSTGGDVESGDPRKFDLTDAIFIPGIHPFSVNSIADNNNDVQLIYRGTGLRIKKNGNIEIGESSFKKLMTENIIPKFNGHTHIDSSAAPTGPPTGSTPPTTYTSADATQKVEAQ